MGVAALQQVSEESQVLALKSSAGYERDPADH